jgi:tRNA C32,U32 (ribose-2'-O)-methylase TrmJ
MRPGEEEEALGAAVHAMQPVEQAQLEDSLAVAVHAIRLEW